MSRNLSVYALLPALILCLEPLSAQQASGKITGIVTDPTGSAVPGVMVTATNVLTGETRQNESNASGTYVLTPLPVGNYRLDAQKAGFKALSHSGIRIDVNSAPTIDLQLEVGALNERVNVSAAAPTIDTENQAVGNSRYEIQLKSLPIIVREVQALVGQTAGVPYGTTDTVGGNYQQGGRSSMQVLSDGTQLDPFQTTGWPAIDGIGRRADLTIPGVDSVAEVKWVTNGGSAEYISPTQVIIASKSGTNQLHSSLFEYYRSGGLGARRWELPKRDSFVRHQFGGTVGGKIIKDKMFFFGGVDVFSHTLGATLTVRQPTAAERSGDLSDLLKRTDARGNPSPVSIFDPLSGQPFPGNIIPASRLSPVATQLLTLIPAAATPAGNLSSFNAFIFKPEYDKSHKYDARWDYNLSDRDRLFARTTIGHLDQFSRFSGSVPGPYGYSTKNEWTQAVSTNWTRIIDPSLVTTFQFTFRNMPFENLPSAGNTTFPVPIANLSPKPPFGGPPAILINSNGLGISDLFDRLLFNYDIDHAFTIDPSVSKTIGNHTLKAGFTYLWGVKADKLASPPYGRFQTTSDYNNPKSTTSATGDAFADFLLGYPSTTDVTVGPAGGHLSKSNIAAYIQDDWKVTSKLTLNLGLRYDRFGFFRETNLQSAASDFSLGKVVIQNNSQNLIQPAFQQFSNLFITASQVGLPGTFIQPNNLDFTPRLGVAYRIRPSLVIRGGFGIYASDITYNEFNNQYNGPPFVHRSQLSRSLLISQGVDVNSVYTFQNPTANGSAADATAAMANIGGFQNSYPTEKSYTWNTTVEDDLGHGMALRATYAGNSTRNMSRQVQINGCAPGPTECLSRSASDPTGRKYPLFNTNFAYHAADGLSNFNDGEIEFSKRFSNGLLFDINYAHSRLLGQQYVATNPVADPHWSYDYGPVSLALGSAPVMSAEPNDVIHWNYVWELPFGHGRRFAGHMNPVVEALLGGWLLSGLGTWESGLPLTITASSGQSPSGATVNRANRTGSGSLSNPGPIEWFDTSAYQLPAFIKPSATRPTRQFGTSGVATVYGPHFFTYDMTLHKTFTIKERYNLQFRVEAYNPFNHPDLANPDTEVTSATFGQIRTSNTNYNPRSIQFGARLDF